MTQYKTIHDLTALGAAPAADDEIEIWDASAQESKKVTVTEFAASVADEASVTEAELTAAVVAHVDDASGAHAASAISVTTTTQIKQTTVQAALAARGRATSPGPAPVTAASGPTVTPSFSATTTITNSVLVPYTDSRLECLGNALTACTGTFSGMGAALAQTPLTMFPAGVDPKSGAYFAVEFDWDGAAFEFLHNDGGGGRCRVSWDNLDGTGWQQEPDANWYSRNVPGDNGLAGYLTKVDFTTRAVRRIRLDFRGPIFGGIRIGPNDSVWKPAIKKGPRVLVVGDSYTQGTTTSFGSGNSAGMITWALHALRRLGVRDIWVDANGGTGFQNPGSVINASFVLTESGSPSGGTFTITWNGSTTSAIAYNASSSTVQTALEALFGAGNITVTGSAGGPYTCTLAGSRVGTAINLPTRTSSITGGSINVSVNAVGQTNKRYDDRLAGSISCAPDIVILAGGLNDLDTTNTTIYPAGTGTALAVFRAQVDACITTAKAVASDVIVVGPFAASATIAANTANSQNTVGIAGQMSAAAAAANVTYIDPRSEPWITGTGKVGTTTGSGNADLYTCSDGVHPSPAGYAYLGARVAAAILASESLPTTP